MLGAPTVPALAVGENFAGLQQTHVGTVDSKSFAYPARASTNVSMVTTTNSHIISYLGLYSLIVKLHIQWIQQMLNSRGHFQNSSITQSLTPFIGEIYSTSSDSIHKQLPYFPADKTRLIWLFRPQKHRCVLSYGAPCLLTIDFFLMITAWNKKTLHVQFKSTIFVWRILTQ